MNENKNFLIAFGLSIVVMLGFYQFYEKPKYEKLAQEQRLNPAQTPLNIEKAPGNSAQQSLLASSQVVPMSTESPRIKIESDSIIGSIRQLGGVFDDLRLKKYKETTQENSQDVRLLDSQVDNTYKVIVGWKADNLNAGKMPDANVLWQLQHSENTTLTPEKPLVLVWFNDRGLKFERTITMDDQFVLTISEQVTNHGEEEVRLQPCGEIQRKIPPAASSNFILHEGPIGYFNKKLFEDSYEDIEKHPVSQKSIGGWLGFTDKYWLVSLIPDQKTNVTIEYLKQEDGYYARFTGASLVLKPGESGTYTYYVYAGAKVLRTLDNYEKKLGITHFDLAVDFGWFYFLTKPLFYVLEYFHQLLGNLGLAILLLTVLFRIVLYPMATKSYRSMARMKAMQPKIMHIQNLYKNDKVKQSQELMALYKKEGINPAGGCLPMLVQAPIFFCLYKVLFVSIEMRQAPFFGWIHDLSIPDPTSFINLFGLLPFNAPSFLQIGILPLLMGASMVIQQKMNPQPADPMQAKMMMILPIVFTFLFASFPAGLVVYWTWNNILSMAQQWLIMKQVKVK